MADTEPGGDVFLASLELGGSTLPISVHASIDGAKCACADDAATELGWEDVSATNAGDLLAGALGDGAPMDRRWYSVARFMVHP